MMLAVFLKYKKQIIISIIALIVIVLAYTWYKKTRLTTADVPNDEPGATPTQAEIDKANELARALYTNLDGVTNPFSRNMQPYKNLMQASDKIFVMTYNRFNTLYQMAGKGTLREWLKTDWFTQNDWEYITDTIFPRMDKLNLT